HQTVAASARSASAWTPCIPITWFIRLTSHEPARRQRRARARLLGVRPFLPHLRQAGRSPGRTRRPAPLQHVRRDHPRALPPLPLICNKKSDTRELRQQMADEETGFEEEPHASRTQKLISSISTTAKTSSMPHAGALALSIKRYSRLGPLCSVSRLRS